MEGQEMTVWLVLLDKLIIPLLVILLTPWLHYVTKKGISLLEQKAKVELTDQQVRVIQEITADAIAFAEEQAHKKIRGNQEHLTGAEKADLAVDYARRRAVELGLDDWAEAKSSRLQEQIEAKLARQEKRKAIGVE